MHVKNKKPPERRLLYLSYPSATLEALRKRRVVQKSRRWPALYRASRPGVRLGELGLLLLFLVDSRFLAPTAVLFEFDLALNKLLVLGAPIVDVLAIFAGEFEETILGHMR